MQLMEQPVRPVVDVNGTIERLEGRLLQVAQVEVPLTHRFAPGVYLREVFMPAGTFVIGHEHLTEHFNIVIQGRASVMLEDGKVHEIVAPATFVSNAGVRKVLYIHEDMIWQTVHPTDETNVEKLEAALIVKSETHREHEKLLEDIRQHLELTL